MSRCFPYPPPGFNGKRASNEALIESIKLQKEKEKAKTERKKEKKREKKEKRREIKENKDHVKFTSTGTGHEEYTRKGEKIWTELEGHKNKRRLEDAEQLERSGITEEHVQPVNLQNPSYSSDSIHNSNKRRKQASPVNGSRGHGNIIRIRLPLQKHKVPDVSASKEQLCSSLVRKGQHKESDVPTTNLVRKGQHKEFDVSTSQKQLSSGRTDISGHRGHDVDSRASQEAICSTSLRTNNVLQELPFGPGKELSCSTSGRIGIFAQDDKQIASGSTSFENEMHKLNSLYNDLFQNLVPPALPSERSDFDDEEWLFRRKRSDREMEKRSKASADVSCCGYPTMMGPRAQYLPEAEIYALPYTVPF